MGGRWDGWGVYVSCFPSLPTFTVKSKEQHLFYIVKNKKNKKHLLMLWFISLTKLKKERKILCASGHFLDLLIYFYFHRLCEIQKQGILRGMLS